MTWLLQIAVFALGVCISMHMIAALHGAVDLWYDIVAMSPRVVGRIAVWEAVILAILWLLELPYQGLFLAGLWMYLLFYLSLLPLTGLYIRLMRSDRRTN